MTEPDVAVTAESLHTLKREELHEQYDVPLANKDEMVEAVIAKLASSNDGAPSTETPAASPPEPSAPAAPATAAKVTIVAGMPGDTHYDPETKLTIAGHPGTEVAADVADGIITRALASGHTHIYRKA